MCATDGFPVVSTVQHSQQDMMQPVGLWGAGRFLERCPIHDEGKNNDKPMHLLSVIQQNFYIQTH